MQSNRSEYLRVPFAGLLFLLGYLSPILSETSVNDHVTPNIVDFKVIVQQHYSKRQYSVLSDTLNDPAFPNKKWVVINDVVVPEKMKLIVPQGVEVFFEPNTSIRVNGTIEAIGTLTSPIRFSKADSADMLKKPDNNNFKWNGIKVSKKGRAVLRNVVIEYSQSGLSSEGVCDSLKLESVNFLHTTPLTLHTSDFSIPIPANISFDLTCPTPTTISKRKPSGFLYWFYGAGVAGALTSGTFAYMAYKNDHEAAKKTDHFMAQSLADKATQQYNMAKWVGISAAGVIVPTVIIHLTIANRKGNNK